MIWQDLVITSVNILFGVMLLPQLKDTIKKGHYMNLYSCGFTFIGLCICNITFATLELWLSAIPICTVMWGLLLYYSWRNKK